MYSRKHDTTYPSKPWSSLYQAHHYPARIDVRKELFLRNTFSFPLNYPPLLPNPHLYIPNSSSPKIKSNNNTTPPHTIPHLKQPSYQNPTKKTSSPTLPTLLTHHTTPKPNQSAESRTSAPAYRTYKLPIPTHTPKLPKPKQVSNFFFKKRITRSRHLIRLGES